MAVTQFGTERPAHEAVHRSLDLATSPEAAFALICEVEKWPVWLSFLRSARVVDGAGPLRPGSEVALRSAIPGEEEELYEVDRFLEGHVVSLVGAYSVRRRIDFRIERKTDRSKIVVRVDYPAYGGHARRFDRPLDGSAEARPGSRRLAAALQGIGGIPRRNRGPAHRLLDFSSR